MSRLLIRRSADMMVGRACRPCSMVSARYQSNTGQMATTEKTTHNHAAAMGLLNPAIMAVMMAQKTTGHQATGESPGNPKLMQEINNKDFIVDNFVDRENKASPEQLTSVANTLKYYLPRFIASSHPFDLYTKDVVFIDNIRSKRVQGTGQYALQVSLVKLYFILNYSGTRLELLNLVTHPEESCIKIRWRFVCKPGLIRFMLFFYNFHSTEIWKDGISTMYVNKEGKISCHVCDNIDIEKEEIKTKKTAKNPLINRGLHV